MIRPIGILALAAVALPASAGIVWDTSTPSLPITAFQTNFWSLDNTALSIGSGAALASSLFAGQGWAYSARAADEQAPWESPVGTPTPATNLALLGQYPPTVPPSGSPSVDPTKYQNVVSFDPGAPLLDRFGGMVDNYYMGVTSILFTENIDTFSLQVLDAGIDKDDGLGGPVHFAFFGRQGNFLQAIDFAKAVDGLLTFRSSAVDIAGIQIWHEDPRGLEYRTLRFGAVPVPATLGLVLFGLAALRRTIP